MFSTRAQLLLSNKKRKIAKLCSSFNCELIFHNKTLYFLLLLRMYVCVWVSPPVWQGVYTHIRLPQHNTTMFLMCKLNEIPVIYSHGINWIQQTIALRVSCKCKWKWKVKMKTRKWNDKKEKKVGRKNWNIFMTLCVIDLGEIQFHRQTSLTSVLNELKTRISVCLKSTTSVCSHSRGLGSPKRIE